MGRKVHPYGFRLGTSRTWNAKWYADKEYTSLLKEDIAIRQLLDRRLANASVSGGTENTKYYVSGLVKNDEGIALNTGKLLKKDTVEQMWTEGRTADGTGTGYGLGIGVFPAVNGVRPPAHPGLLGALAVRRMPEPGQLALPGDGKDPAERILEEARTSTK